MGVAMRVRMLASTVLFLGAGALAQEKQLPSAASGGFARPELPAKADTNDPAAYYTLGSLLMEKDPIAAGYAFYWASLLDPANPEAYYARSTSIVLAWFAYGIDKFETDPGFSGEMPQDLNARADTLMFEALTRNPFVDRRFDLLLFRRSVRTRMANSNDPMIQGFYAYAMHEWGKAAAAWAKTLKKRPELLSFHIRRAQAFYFAQEYDSSYAEYKLYVDTLETRQRERATRYYESKSTLRYAMGIVRRKQGRADAAREEFGAALTENIGLYMAHVQLAELDLLAGDTTGALGEFALAADIRAADPVVRAEYGALLRRVHRDDDALRQLDAAIALDPYYAPPYEAIGRIHDAHGRPSEAMRSYVEYLQRAPRDAALRPEVEQRLTALRGGS